PTTHFNSIAITATDVCRECAERVTICAVGAKRVGGGVALAAERRGGARVVEAGKDASGRRGDRRLGVFEQRDERFHSARIRRPAQCRRGHRAHLAVLVGERRDERLDGGGGF